MKYKRTIATAVAICSGVCALGAMATGAQAASGPRPECCTNDGYAGVSKPLVGQLHLLAGPLGEQPLRAAAMTEVTALIPAHNEQETICDAIEAVNGQVDRVIVVADNCTDDTIELARSNGAEVFETVANRAKKAGGLNQALAALLPQACDGDFFLVTDADSRIAPGFVAEALARFAQPRVGAWSLPPLDRLR